jgi:hypothetical protein
MELVNLCFVKTKSANFAISTLIVKNLYCIRDDAPNLKTEGVIIWCQVMAAIFQRGSGGILIIRVKL